MLKQLDEAVTRWWIENHPVEAHPLMWHRRILNVKAWQSKAFSTDTSLRFLCALGVALNPHRSRNFYKTSHSSMTFTENLQYIYRKKVHTSSVPQVLCVLCGSLWSVPVIGYGLFFRCFCCCKTWARMCEEVQPVFVRKCVTTAFLLWPLKSFSKFISSYYLLTAFSKVASVSSSVRGSVGHSF